MESVDITGVLERWWRQEMLNQGPTSDLKCKLNFFIILYSSTSIIFPQLSQDTMIILLLLQMMERREARVWLIFIGIWKGSRCWVSHFFSIFCCFCAVFNYFFMNGSWWLLCLFLCFFFDFFISSNYDQALLVHRNYCVCVCFFVSFLISLSLVTMIKRY